MPSHLLVLALACALSVSQWFRRPLLRVRLRSHSFPDEGGAKWAPPLDE